jgi:hypothetical protein
MILVDANLLIYAVNRDAPRHKTAREWFEQAVSGHEPVGLPWTCLLAFLRITTRPGILAKPLTVDQAVGYVESWLKQPFVEAVAPGSGHWPILHQLLQATGTAGNLTSDLHLAAMAIERSASLCSADHDYRRFAGLEHVNPLGEI